MTLTETVMEEVQSSTIMTLEGSGNENATQIIQKFREMISDIELDEHSLTERELLRWLQARYMDAKSAEEMLRMSHRWRKENGIDRILNWEPPHNFIQDFPFQICGFDNDGDQFGVVTWKKWKIENFIEAIPVNKGKLHLQYFWQCLERVKQIMKAHSTEEKNIYSGIVIVDMEGLALSQFASKEIIEVILDATRQYEANYPGFLKKAIVVNTPQIFSVLWSLMKPFLSAETVASVEIYGYYDDWRSILRTHLPHEQIPSRYGGANTTTQSYHPSHGYKISLPVFDEITHDELKPTSVPAGQKLDMSYELVEGQKMSWAFKTDDYDIGFGVFDENETEVVDFCRVDAHMLTQRGTYICNKSGKYIIRFDNTTSWIRPKALYYQIKITST